MLQHWIVLIDVILGPQYPHPSFTSIACLLPLIYLLEEVMREVGLKEMKVYIQRRQNAVAH